MRNASAVYRAPRTRLGGPKEIRTDCAMRAFPFGERVEIPQAPAAPPVRHAARPRRAALSHPAAIHSRRAQRRHRSVDRRGSTVRHALLRATNSSRWGAPRVAPKTFTVRQEGAPGSEERTVAEAPAAAQYPGREAQKRGRTTVNKRSTLDAISPESPLRRSSSVKPEGLSHKFVRFHN